METMQITQHNVHRVHEAIAECDRYIAKEGPRNPDLRPEWAAKHLEFCKNHKAKLIAMLGAA